MADEYSEDALKKHRDLLIACGWGKEVDVILLLQQGASVRVQDQDGKNCLHYAACKGHIQVTNLLIENGCSINAKDKSDRTPLHLASEEGHHDIVSILLDNNAEFDVQDQEGNTACHLACLNDYVEVIELLIHIKADLNIRNRDGFTPLHIATVNHNVKAMTILMKAGVSKTTQDLHGNTALHLAVKTKSIKALKCLIKNGADVNIQNHDGNSALHLASDTGEVQYVEYILNADQPVELSANNVGDSAKDIAIRHGFRDIVQLIPDPYKKKKTKRRSHRSSGSPTSPTASQLSAGSPVPVLNDENGSPHRKQKYNRSSDGSPTTFVQHPSLELPTATSSSLLSLWVPTTDSGISLPMDVKADRIHTFMSSSQRKKHKKGGEKNRLLEDLQQYDRHRKDEKKHKSSKREKIYTHEYEELKHDPRFMSPHQTPMRVGKKNTSSPQKVRYSGDLDIDYLSDESIQYQGCFFKSKSKKSNKGNSAKSKQKHVTDEKELMMIRQAELQYQLNASKVSLEKQMKKMRKKFERALQATDERFIEQKKREEDFHNKLRAELEIIETSLERGSKKNVEEFSQHIKIELNKLTEKLTRGLDLNANDSNEDYGSPFKRLNKRASAVDLDKDISVSLPKNSKQASLRSKKKNISEDQNAMVQMYEQRLKELEIEAKQKAKKEMENEALRARVLELEQMVKAERTKTS